MATAPGPVSAAAPPPAAAVAAVPPAPAKQPMKPIRKLSLLGGAGVLLLVVASVAPEPFLGTS